jgi:hypothetical protein
MEGIYELHHWEGSGAVIYMLSFIKIGSIVQKLLGEKTYRQQGALKSLLLFFQNKESVLKTDSRLQLLRHLPALQKYTLILLAILSG